MCAYVGIPRNLSGKEIDATKEKKKKQETKNEGARNKKQEKQAEVNVHMLHCSGSCDRCCKYLLGNLCIWSRPCRLDTFLFRTLRI
jgi:hypothetical protein